MKRFLLAFAVLLGAAVALRLPALDQPLDRDQALYASIGQRLSVTTLPYRDLFDHKQPLIHYVFAGLNLIAPGSLLAIRLAAGVPSALIGALLLVFLAPLTGMRRAALAAGLVVVLSASTQIHGTDLNTEHLLTLPAAAAVLWALALGRPGVRGGPFVIGVVAGVAVLAKAIALLIVLAALIPLLTGRGERSALSVLVRFGVGLALPAALVLAAYALARATGDLWFANWTYNSRYVGEQGFTLSPLGPDGIRLLLAAALCCGVLRLGALRGRDVVTWTFLAWLVGAYLGAQTSSRGYGHYYAPLVAPAVALLVLPVPNLGRVLAAVLAFAALGAVLLAIPVVTNFGRGGDEIASRVYGRQELARWKPADEIGPFLRSRARAGDRLFVVGSEPQYYWRSGLPAAKRWLFDYPAEIAPERFYPEVAGLCRGGPRFVVVVADPLPAYARRCTTASGYREVMRRGPVSVLERSAAR